MFKYYEIAKKLEESFRKNKFKQGDKVPSIREICNMYNCSKSTASKALNLLEDKEILYCIAQSGYYYMNPSINIKNNSKIINFKSTSPDAQLFPYKDFQKCLNLAIERHKEDLFEYSNIDDHILLRKEILNLVADDFIFTRLQNIVITSGVQQSLTLLTEMEMPNKNSKVLIENPTYHRYIQYLKNNSINTVTINRSFKGIDLKNLENIFSTGEIKLFYITTRVHNPLGTSLTEYEKKEIIRLAYKYNVYIIEDDYMGDYILDSKNTPLITYDSNKSHVIYVRSFSKIIFPGLRVGFAILPNNLIETFKNIKYYSDLGTPLLNQVALQIYLKNKMFYKHTSKMKNLYLKKAQKMIETLNEFNIEGSFEFNESLPVPHTCIKLKKTRSIKKLNAKGFEIMDFKEYYYNIPKDINYYMLLNVYNVDEESLYDAIKEFATIIN